MKPYNRGSGVGRGATKYMKGKKYLGVGMMRGIMNPYNQCGT